MNKSEQNKEKDHVFPCYTKIKFMCITIPGFSIRVFVFDFHCKEAKLNTTFSINPYTAWKHSVFLF